MDILYLLVPLGVVFVGLIAVVLFWAIQSGQFDELEEHGESVLKDPDSP